RSTIAARAGANAAGTPRPNHQGSRAHRAAEPIGILATAIGLLFGSITSGSIVPVTVRPAWQRRTMAACHLDRQRNGGPDSHCRAMWFSTIYRPRLLSESAHRRPDTD